MPEPDHAPAVEQNRDPLAAVRVDLETASAERPEGDGLHGPPVGRTRRQLRGPSPEWGKVAGMSEAKPSKRTPSWFVIKSSARVGNEWLDVYLDHNDRPIRFLSGAARFITFPVAAQRLHQFQSGPNQDEATKWYARVVGLFTKSGQP